MTVVDLVKFKVKWSPSREQLIYCFYREPDELILWQARNFKQGTTHKTRFFTGGTPERVVAAYYPEQGDRKTAVVVEDCISAIKIAKSGRTGIPAFSSSMSSDKLARVAAMYDEVFCWLDSDKFNESTKLSNRFKLCGARSRVIHTQYDPKEYSIDEINGKCVWQ